MECPHDNFQSGWGTHCPFRRRDTLLSVWHIGLVPQRARMWARWTKAARRSGSGGSRTGRHGWSHVNKGLPIIRQWLIAAYHQIAHVRVAKGGIQRTSGQPLVAPQEMIEYLRKSQQDFTRWAMNWIMPESVRKNTGLIFDCVIEYYADQAASATMQAPVAR